MLILTFQGGSFPMKAQVLQVEKIVFIALCQKSKYKENNE